MAAVQQHTSPSSESRSSKAFMDSMEEEVRRCSEHLQRRQSKRSMRTLNGYARSPDDLNSGEEAGAGRRFASTLPRSFTMPSNPETRDIPYSSSRARKSHSPSSRTPRTPTMKAPIGATTLHEGALNSDQPRASDYRGRSAPPESFNYFSSSGSEPGYSSRESSLTPIGMAARSLSESPRSSLSPPPVGPKPNGRSREKAWSNVRRNKSEESPKIIRALPESSTSPQPIIPVSNQPINVPLSPMEFPSAEIDVPTTFGGFGEIPPLTSPRMATPPPNIHEPPQATLDPQATTTDLETIISELSMAAETSEPEQTDSATIEPAVEENKAEPNLDGGHSVTAESKPEETTMSETEPQEETTVVGIVQKEAMSALETRSNEAHENTTSKEVTHENTTSKEVTHENTTSKEVAHENTTSKEVILKDITSEEPKPTDGHLIIDNQSLAELSAPEVKSIPKKVRRKSSSSKDGSPTVAKGSPSKRRHSRTHSESKIQITVSSSMKIGELIESKNSKISDVGKTVDEKIMSMLKDLQAKLVVKDEEISKLNERCAKILHEKNEQIKKHAKDTKKIEREKWELLKRARDAAERALHLRTQLDMKEGSIRGTQSELDRTKDELFSVKSANTSLRALLGELRTPPKTGVDASVQVDLGGATLKRNKSMELAFTHGGLSQEQQENVTPERASDFRTSTASLSTHWPERSFSDKWERADTTSLCEDVPLPLGGFGSASQPVVPWPELRKGKRKKSGIMGGRLRRSTGSKRGSITSVDGLDMSNSSILAGAGLRGTTTNSFPYTRVPSDIREQWKVLEQAKGIPFHEWTVQHVVAWMETGLGMIQYRDAVRDRFPSGSALLSLSDSEMDKKLGISQPLHRKKLRLAIEEQRHPENCQYPHAGKIDHAWVALEWAHDCGLAHLTEVLTANLVDGRLLNTLSKEEIRKYLKITRKVDQLSFFSAVELLRMHDFNRQAIQEHRRATKNPLYWTNRNICDWLKDIQLEEYATNVIGGGVHGALLFLERGHFTSDHLASIIQIPSGKGQLRRHLAGKMARLFTEDVSQSMESLPHLLMASSPTRLSAHGSQSPDRRSAGMGSPRHTSSTPPPSGDCPHPSRKNSLTRGALLESLTQSAASAPRQFARTSSGPSPHSQRLLQVSAAERVRLSLRESALRSVSSINEETTPTPHPTPRSFTPTLTSSSGTTV